MNFNHLLPSCEDTVGPVLIVSFNYCVCLFLANLIIASAQIARSGGLLIEYIVNQKFEKLAIRNY